MACEAHGLPAVAAVVERLVCMRNLRLFVQRFSLQHENMKVMRDVDVKSRPISRQNPLEDCVEIFSMKLVIVRRDTWLGYELAIRL